MHFTVVIYLYVGIFFLVHFTQRKINELSKKTSVRSKTQQKKTNSDHEQVQQREVATVASTSTTTISKQIKEEMRVGARWM